MLGSVIVRLLTAAAIVVDVTDEVVRAVCVVDARSAQFSVAVVATACWSEHRDEKYGEHVRGRLHDRRRLSTPSSVRLRQLAASTLRLGLA